MLQCRCMLTIYVLVPVLVSSPVSEGKSTHTGATHCIWVSVGSQKSAFFNVYTIFNYLVLSAAVPGESRLVEPTSIISAAAK